jgi:antitoxin component of MazEF toxin-antitoxin module
MSQTRKVIKTGNSLAITIPSKSIKDFNIKEGDLALLKIKHSRASITYIFSGHPRQLSLIEKKSTKR